MAENETLIEFPCDFPIKVMGEAREGFAETITAVIQRYLPDFHAGRVSMRASRGGRYLSLTCSVYVTSKPELDDIYQALTVHPMVLVVL